MIDLISDSIKPAYIPWIFFLTFQLENQRSTFYQVKTINEDPVKM